MQATRPSARIAVVRRALLFIALVVGACGDDRAEEAPQAVSQAAVVGPKVALLSTRPGATETELRLQPIGASTPSAPVGHVPHVADGTVRGALLGDGVVVVADAERRRDPSFGAWLYRLRPGAPAAKLVSGVVHAARPWVTAEGTVLVERGEAGPETDGQLRTDSLTVDEIAPETGAARTVHVLSGYATHIAGVTGKEMLLYRVAWQHADLVAVRIDTGTLRPLLAEMPAFARDFSVDADGARVVFTNRDAQGWVVQAVPLAGGTASELVRVGGMWATPHAFPGGGVLLNDGRGATVVGGNSALSRPLGPGFDELRAATDEWAVLEHHVPSDFSTPFAVELKTGAVQPLAAPRGVRIDVAGVLP